MSRSQLAKLSAQYSLGAGLESRYFEYSTDQEQDCQDCCKYHITEGGTSIALLFYDDINF